MSKKPALECCWKFYALKKLFPKHLEQVFLDTRYKVVKFARQHYFRVAFSKRIKKILSYEIMKNNSKMNVKIGPGFGRQF